MPATKLSFATPGKASTGSEEKEEEEETAAGSERGVAPSSTAITSEMLLPLPLLLAFVAEALSWLSAQRTPPLCPLPALPVLAV